MRRIDVVQFQWRLTVDVPDRLPFPAHAQFFTYPLEWGGW